MGRKFGTCLVVFLAVSTNTVAVAQNAGDVINMFGAIMRAAMIDNARTEWSKVPLNESSCVQQALQQEGHSIDTLVQNGIVPSDPRASNIRASCHVSMVSLPSPRSESVGCYSACNFDPLMGGIGVQN